MTTTEMNIYIKKDAFIRLYMKNPTTLAEIAMQNYLDARCILALNPEITSVNEPINHMFLFLPNRVVFNERDWRKKNATEAVFAIVKDTLRSYSQSIRPKISEIFRLFVDFDHQTHVYLREIQKSFTEKYALSLEKGCEIITHIDCWDNSFKPANLLPKTNRTSYLAYRSGAYNRFTDSVRKMGMFVRDMTYLFHYCFNRETIKIYNYSRTRPALQFADKFCALLLERLQGYLFILMHYYQNLNGSYHDVVNYFRAHEFIEATFGEMVKWYSKIGEISHFTKYPDNFFVYDTSKLPLNLFSDEVNGESFNDEFIFDFTQDYESLLKNDKLKEIAGILDKNVQQFNRDSYTGIKGIFRKSQSLYMSHSVREVQLLIAESETTIDTYKNRGLWGEKLIMDNELTSLRNNAEREIEEFTGIPEAIDDEVLNRMAQKTNIAAYAYFLGLSIHLIVLEVQNQMDLIEKFYKNTDELEDDFRRYIHKLLNIIDKNSASPGEASRELETLYRELGPFQKEALRIINSYQIFNTVVKSLLILVAACVAAKGGGALVKGFMAGMGLSGTAVAATGAFTSQVLAFIIGSKTAESFIEGRMVLFDSKSDFFKDLGTTALTFLWFNVVGALVKVMMRSLHLSTSLLVARYMTSCITMMSATTPVFAFELYRRGQINNRDEWVEFMIVQSILTAVFSGLFMSVQSRMVRVESEVKLKSTAWGAVARYRWEKLQFTMRRRSIQNEMQIAMDEWNRIDKMYRSDFELSEGTSKDMLNAKLSIVNRASTVLKAMKSLNRDLRIFRKNVSINRDYNVDISPENEIEAVEFLLSQAESKLKHVTHIPDQNRVIADAIHNALPRYKVDNSVDGLVLLGKSGSYYNCQRIFRIIQNVPELKRLNVKGAPLRIVDVPEESVFRNLPERYREGILRIQGKWEIDGKSGVSEITVVDIKGKGVVPKEYFQERYRPEPVKEENTP